jgi:predicted ATPase
MRPTPSAPAQPASLFYSYSHVDAPYREALQKGLRALEEGLVSGWSDGHINPGGHWKKEIADHLSSADVILLLISPDFYSSKFCRKEMKIALEREVQGDALVIPVLVRPFEWPDPPYADIQKLPDKEKPISKWEDKDDAYASIAQGLWKALVDRPFYNVPSHASPFVGRKREMEDVRKLLMERRTRVVVLHGGAGTGSTRLASHVGEELFRQFHNGVCFISREQIRDSPSLASAIAGVLRVKEKNALDDNLLDHLQDKQMLLILDGMESLGSEEPWIAELLASCRQLKILMTSRTPLRVQGGVDYQLERPLTRKPAEELFADQAQDAAGSRGATPSPKVMASICKDLDGHALAIKMAARADRPEDIGTEGRGPASWPRALRVAVAGTFLQLGAARQKLFSRLSVFPASWTVAAAHEICNAGRDLGIGDMKDELGHLEKKGFLEPEGGERYKMQDTFRDFAAAELEPDEEEELRRQHAKFFVSLAEEVEPRLTSARRNGWPEILEAENANFRAALAWCRTVLEGAEWGVRLAGSLFWFWNLRGDFDEGRKCLESCLGQAGSGRTAARARALYAAGGLAFLQGDRAAARPWLQESVEIFRETLERRRLGFALILLGMVTQEENDFERALKCEHESIDIFRELKDTWGLALAMNDLGNVYRSREDSKAAIDLYRGSLREWRKLGDHWGLALTLNNLGFMEMRHGDLDRARETFEEACEFQSGEDERWGLAETVKYLGDVAARQGRDADAEALYRESLEMNRKIGRKPLILGCLAGLAAIACRHGHLPEAARLSGAVDALSGPRRRTSKPLNYEMCQEVAERLRETRDDSGELRRARLQGEKMDIAQIALRALTWPPFAPADPKPQEEEAPSVVPEMAVV